MDLVFVTDPITDLLPGHDTSVALMEAAQERGHRVLVTTVRELGYVERRARATCRRATVRPAVLDGDHWTTDPDWVALDEPIDYCLDDARVLFMRADPPVDDDYLRATYLLDFVDPASTLLVNDPAGLRHANEKLFGLVAPDLMPRTVVSSQPQVIRDAVASWGRAVLKPTDCMAGRGILVLEPADPNLASILDSATLRGQRHVVVQEWVAGVEDGGDRRVMVLDGQPIGVVRRVAGSGDFRCNMATGAAPVADEVTDGDREICARLAPHLRACGLHLVGLDVIAGLLTEVNVTSPTGIREIDALTGTRLADDVIAWTETALTA